MATFVSTTLTKRTGATTTVFAPGNIQSDGTGVFFSAAALAGFGPKMELRSWRVANGRNARVKITIPQLSPVNTTSILYRPYGSLDVYIPDGTLQTDVNDIIGYINAATAAGLTNLNGILVNGDGVY